MRSSRDTVPVTIIAPSRRATRLTVSVIEDARNCGVRSRLDGVDDRAEQRRRSQRTRGVVDDDDVGVGAVGESGAHRGGAA